jgi:hypothetical protein
LLLEIAGTRKSEKKKNQQQMKILEAAWFNIEFDLTKYSLWVRSIPAW